MSEAEAMSTASVFLPSWYQRRRRAGALTACQERMSALKHGPKTLRALAHDHVAAAADRLRQPADRVQQSAHVGLRVGGQWMEDGAHAQVGLHEGFDLDVARALQHGRVGPHVELDGMLAGPARPGR